jgi:omega-6 fatty acid desaturase (delta-12 desaturase)
MSDEKELIVSTKPFACEIRQKSWYHLLSTLLLVVPTVYIILGLENSWVRLVASGFLGLLIVRIFVIYHDYCHNAIFQKSLPAEIFFKLFGLYILAPKSIWKRSHDYHHKNNCKLYTSSIGSYKIITKEKYLTLSRKERFLYLFERHPLTILFGYLFVFIFGMSFLSFYRNPSKHWDSLVALLLHACIGSLIYIYFSWSGLLLVFIIPNFISTALGSYLFYAQHNFPGATFKDKDGWTYVYAALQSSSYMKLNRFLNWATANIGYHHIHHLNARIPFYRLPEVYSAMPELQNVKTTTMNFSEILRCLQLKVWDPQLQRMITYREIFS